MSPQQKVEAFERVKEQAAKFDLDQRRACLLHAALLPPILRDYGVRSVLQAGSASFRFKAREKDDGGPDHYSYVWDIDDPLTRSMMISGYLPELHCWVGIPKTNELVDTTTENLMELQKVVLPDDPWSAPPPPPFLWADCMNLPDGFVYSPCIKAIKVAMHFLRTGWPEVFARLMRASYSEI